MYPTEISLERSPEDPKWMMIEINNLFKNIPFVHISPDFWYHQNRSKVVTFWSKLSDLVTIRTDIQGRIMTSSETQLFINFLENRIKSNAIIFWRQQWIFTFFIDFDLLDFKAKIHFMWQKTYFLYKNSASQNLLFSPKHSDFLLIKYI